MTKFFGRAAFTFLLALGLNALLASFNLPDPKVLFKAEALVAGVALRYNIDAFFGAICLVMPVVVEILSVGWTLEDAGLVHYYLPETMDKMFDIEPVYRKYNRIVKGFAGISSVLFYIGTFAEYPAKFPGDVAHISVLTAGGIALAFSITPAYLLYTRLGKAFLRKDLKRAERIQEAQLCV